MKGLSNFFIEKKLKNINSFIGIIPFNHLSKSIFKNKRRAFLILNSDYCSKKGEHWFVVEKNNKTYYVFDSLGGINTHHKNIEKVISCKTIRNNFSVQNILSNSCGLFCILYIKLRFIGFPFKEILSFFDKNNTNFNEKLLKKIITLLRF